MGQPGLPGNVLRGIVAFILCLFIITIPLAVLVAIRSFRLTLNDDGMSLRGWLGSKQATWDEIETISTTVITITENNNDSGQRLIEFLLELRSGKKLKARTRVAEADYLIGRFVEKGKMDPEMDSLIS